ncbi:hypothetical protein ACFXO9_31650 [Nocardia tengchongensis]|uniref:TY-Chap domain-containing protein n=1 Tax=Nocardia tengchongensis TaxID=2055889 RepID=UPI003683E988
MAGDFWVELQGLVPEMLCAVYDDDFNQIQRWSFVRLHDVGNGTAIVFYENGKMLEVEVRVPDNPTAAHQLRTVLSSHPAWYTREDAVQRWTTRWRLPTEDGFPVNDDYYADAAAAVVAAMRDGLGMDPSRMRFTAGDEKGPDVAPETLCQYLTGNRPTMREAPENCTEWGDFAERLDWALRTLADGSIVDLWAPGVEGHNGLEFIEMNGRLEAVSIAEGVDGPELEDLHRRMNGIGWPTEADVSDGLAIWRCGPFSSHAGLSNHRLEVLPALAVATFRDVYGLTSPEHMIVTSNTNYLGAELGIRSLRR